MICRQWMQLLESSDEAAVKWDFCLVCTICSVPTFPVKKKNLKTKIYKKKYPEKEDIIWALQSETEKYFWASIHRYGKSSQFSYSI